jgi:hypothetical protein
VLTETNTQTHTETNTQTQLHWHTPCQNKFLLSQWPSNIVCKRPRISRGGQKKKQKAKEDSVAPYDRWVEYCDCELEHKARQLRNYSFGT